MALNTVIRRVASKVVPLAVRASAGSQRSIHLQRNLAALCSTRSQNLLQRSFPSVQRFSTAKSSDASLLKVLDSELKCALESQDEEQPEGIPENFPFKIEDKPGQANITLTRQYQSESISVDVHMLSLSGDENEEENEDNQDDDEDTEKASQSNMPLVVKITKKNGLTLEFGCTAYPDDIVIDSLSVKNPDQDEELAYAGPDFMDLDENLQKAFHKYLEIRGIKPSTTNFLHGYMIEKDGKEYIEWLKNIQKFVQA